jgi:peptidoglycan-associated lipoprotein
MIRNKIFLLAFSAAILVACGTKVPITEQAPVTDRAVQPLAQPVPPAAPLTSASSRDIKPIEAAPLVVARSGVIYFDFDSFVVKPEFQSTLEAQAKFLTANRTAKISLGGHTDDLGGREYNLALGQKRADAVKRSLSILGVAEAQMESISFGKEKPASASADDQSRAKNRRVELVVP